MLRSCAAFQLLEKVEQNRLIKNLEKVDLDPNFLLNFFEKLMWSQNTLIKLQDNSAILIKFRIII